MRADMQGFCKFKVASRIDIFILQKTKKHISLNKHFGRQCFISRTGQGRKTLVVILKQTKHTDMGKLNINDFELGDKVNHVSNSTLLMVVIQIHTDNNEIICRWVDSKSNSQTQGFIPQELAKEKPYEPDIFLG